MRWLSDCNMFTRDRNYLDKCTVSCTAVEEDESSLLQLRCAALNTLSWSLSTAVLKGLQQ